jgi:hypothetical protein
MDQAGHDGGFLKSPGSLAADYKTLVRSATGREKKYGHAPLRVTRLRP